MKRKAFKLSVVLPALFMVFMYGCNEVANNSGWDEAKSNSDHIKEMQHYLRDYQLEYHMDTLWIYEGDRVVGMNIDSNALHGAFIDTTILNDNR